MDIEKIRKYANKKVLAGNHIDSVRTVLKDARYEKQDQYEGVSEVYKPLIDKQEVIKETINKRQDELIEELKNNQKAITSGLEDIILYNNDPEIKYTKTKLPIGYQPSMLSGKKEEMKSDLDKGFSTDNIETLSKYDLLLASSVLKRSIKGDDIIKEYLQKTAKKLKQLGGLKGSLSKNKKQRDKEHRRNRWNIERYNNTTKISFSFSNYWWR